MKSMPSLRSKFSIVLVLLGLTLAVNVALTVWSIRFLERELAWPLRSAQPVLSGLHQVKRLGEQQANALGSGRSGAGIEPDAAKRLNAVDVAPELIEAEQAVIDELIEMRSLSSLQLRSGVSTTENLRARSEHIMGLLARWQRGSDPDVYRQIVEQIGERHELIERIEGRIIEDARLAADYGRRLKIVILVIIAVSVLGVGLSAMLAAVLLKRWVLVPVGLLRSGAERLGAGDLDHRIDISTGDELGQLGDEFNRMASLLKAMQDERIERERLAAMGEMAQRTVHNLRTPLAGIRALAETARSEMDEDSELSKMQERIISTVDRFESWLQSMLRVSSPLGLEHREYDPQGLILAVMDSHRGAAERRSLKLGFEQLGQPRQAMGDPDQLEHAITAVLSNAIDFAEPGGEITLVAGESDAYWTLRISNEGPAIPPDLQVSIFRPYFTTRRGGTGIGLAMVKRIVEQHHGRVEVESPTNPDSGTGAAFFFWIPVDARG